ncbi:MAG: GNAT family N-acetyltransferase [Burkholderiales bacterium]|jgi:GNAT superfamily N-acetyltransferase|nr:GNAT family N-acetyltransferase [Burkholderiales bacterium]
MSAPAFIRSDPVEHYDAIVSINIEYMSWVRDEMERSFGANAHDGAGMPVADYVAGVIHQVCGERPPKGTFYLIEVDGSVAGMCGLRFVRSDVAEIKRLYVRPAYRGMNLGQLALRRLISDAGSFGYRSVCLDTAPFMKAAHRLYETHGFVDCAAYEGTEVPAEFRARWRFMQRQVLQTNAGLLP